MEFVPKTLQKYCFLCKYAIFRLLFVINDTFLLEKLKNVSEGLSVFFNKLNEENVQKNASGSLKEIRVLLKNFNEGRIVEKVSGILENTQNFMDTSRTDIIKDFFKQWYYYPFGGYKIIMLNENP